MPCNPCLIKLAIYLGLPLIFGMFFIILNWKFKWVTHKHITGFDPEYAPIIIMVWIAWPVFLMIFLLMHGVQYIPIILKKLIPEK